VGGAAFAYVNVFKAHVNVGLAYGESETHVHMERAGRPTMD